MPPATATSMSPVAIAWAASITAFSPDPHTLLMVSAATWSESPPRSAACRAGACPSPADTTLPMMHSSTIAGSMPARRTASRTTRAPSCGAVKSFRAPRNLPVGVRAAERMTVVSIAWILAVLTGPAGPPLYRQHPANTVPRWEEPHGFRNHHRAGNVLHARLYRLHHRGR